MENLKLKKEDAEVVAKEVQKLQSSHSDLKTTKDLMISYMVQKKKEEMTLNGTTFVLKTRKPKIETKELIRQTLKKEYNMNKSKILEFEEMMNRRKSKMQRKKMRNAPSFSLKIKKNNQQQKKYSTEKYKSVMKRLSRKKNIAS